MNYSNSIRTWNIVYTDNSPIFRDFLVENERFETRLKTYTGWTAQIIQHEIGHCNGVLI